LCDERASAPRWLRRPPAAPRRGGARRLLSVLIALAAGLVLSAVWLQKQRKNDSRTGVGGI
jgi:ferric-dicitrate binding protein FerR (iron transport regulator)